MVRLIVIVMVMVIVMVTVMAMVKRLVVEMVTVTLPGEGLMCARNHAELFTYTLSFNPQEKPIA